MEISSGALKKERENCCVAATNGILGLNSIGPNVLFLFGSGISIPAGFPSLEQLSARILGSEDLYFDVNKNFQIQPEKSRDSDLVGDLSVPVRMLALLGQIKAEVDAYNQSRLSNYEEWYYLAHQLYSTLSEDYDNPALFEFINRLRVRFAGPPSFYAHVETPENRIRTTAALVMQYIHFMVERELTVPNFNTEYLAWIDDAIADPSLKIKGLFTLNHDLLLEAHFACRDFVDYTIGFDTPNESPPGVHWDRDAVIDATTEKLFLGKLHGSIDWFDYEDRNNLRPNEQGRRVAYVRAYGETDPTISGEKPLLLIGKHNKLFDYTNFVFEDLHYRFYKALRESSDLIVCGYGFGDRGINTRIKNWRQSNPNNRLFIINGDISPLTVTRNIVKYASMQDWETDFSVFHIQEWAETVTWNKIKSAIDNKRKRHTKI